MDKKRRNNQNHANGNGRRNNRTGGNNEATDKNRGEPVAGPSGEGNPSQNRARNREKSNNTFEAKHPIGYKTLEAVLTIDNDSELISKLSSKTNGFLLRLDEPSTSDSFMRLILSALSRVSKTSTELSTKELLVHFYMEIIPKLCPNSNFNRELKLFIASFSNNFFKNIEAIKDLLIFLRRLQLTLYQRSFDAVSDLMPLLTSQVEFVNRKGNALDDFIVVMMTELNDSVEKKDELMKQETEKPEVLLEPPESFRDIGIYPDTFDILSDHEPFIRKNIVKGNYTDVDHYLDVQFRLLREDFVRPLRSGITQYRYIRNKPDEKAKTKFRINDLNIYQNVQIYGSKMLHSEQVHFCRFDVTPFKKIRWQYNKRMMNGSLVCLSPDDFETFFFATVAGQRDPVKLAKGEFQIKLEMENSAMPEITPLINYTMVESHVYFEAYRHNLKVLQGFEKNNFPLEKYIVHVDKDISPPEHLKLGSYYVMSNGLPESDPEAKVMAVDLLGKQQWPAREDFNLDESQYAAFRAALTKQMVVIQGPPGTGKTYIGLRIVEALLSNTRQYPILVVCYTNHALDHPSGTSNF